MIKNSTFLLFFSFFSFAYGQEHNLFDFSNSLKFADYLYKTQEYDLAIQEYKRILFLRPRHKAAGKKILDSYIQSSRYPEGIRYSHLMHGKIWLTDTLQTLQGKLYLLNNDFSSIEAICSTPGLSPKSKMFLEFSRAMFTKDWERAAAIGTSLYDEDEAFEPFRPIVLQANNIQYKSPGLSLALSVVVPGAGKVYCGYWKDGIFSLLFTGISAWQAYRGFDNKGVSSIYGWVMGGISLSFYGGNLYGSVKAANKKNHENEHAVLDNFKGVFLDTYSHF